MRSELENALRGKVTIVGVGNIMRGDDGFGPILAECLKGRVSADVINAGSAPENHVKAIRDSKPDTILVVDTADFGVTAGKIKLLQKSDIPLYGFSTHNASLALFFDFLESETKGRVYMLAVQPKANNMNASLSDVLERTREEVETLFLELLPK